MRACIFHNQEKDTLNRYRLYRRDNRVYSWQDNQDSSKQGSLKTTDREVAEKLLHSKNEAHRNPTLNLAIARTYLSAHDVKMSTRTWADIKVAAIMPLPRTVPTAILTRRTAKETVLANDPRERSDFVTHAISRRARKNEN